MTINDARDFLTLVAVGLTVGGMLFGAAWKLVVRPQLELHIFHPIRDIERDVRRELHANGGTSLKDRIEVGVRTSEEALYASKANTLLIQGVGERLDITESKITAIEKFINDSVQRGDRHQRENAAKLDQLLSEREDG